MFLLDRYAKPRLLRLRETVAAVEDLVFGTDYGQTAQPAILQARVG